MPNFCISSFRSLISLQVLQMLQSDFYPRAHILYLSLIHIVDNVMKLIMYLNMGKRMLPLPPNKSNTEMEHGKSTKFTWYSV